MLRSLLKVVKNIIADPLTTTDYKIIHEYTRRPLASELFSSAQLEEYAGSLAKKHKVTSGEATKILSKRLIESRTILVKIFALLTESRNNGNKNMPAGDSLLDNFHLIDEVFFTAKKDFINGKAKGLPLLLKDDSDNLPRVYDIALELISHSDGGIDISRLIDFLKAYQVVDVLKLQELRVVPTMLKLAIMENLSRLSIQIATDVWDKSVAQYWADQIIATFEKDPKDLVVVIADLARSKPPLGRSFVAEFTRRLQGQGAGLALPLSWLEQQLSEIGLSSAELIQQENQNQAAEKVSINNSLNSIRFLNTTDWRDFLENLSVVEQVLRSDIGGVYERMDFISRENYRRSVEAISKHSTLLEREVAVMAVELAHQNIGENTDPRYAHVGYYLVGKGIIDLAKKAGANVYKSETRKNVFNNISRYIYFGSIALITVSVGLLLSTKAIDEGVTRFWFTLLLLPCVIAVSNISIKTVNWIFTRSIRPVFLPRFDFSEAIPDSCRTMAVVSTVLKNVEHLDELIEYLEIQLLCNPDANLHFSLLISLNNALTETLPEDEALLQAAKNKITELNKKYHRLRDDSFFLFQQPRKWNSKEKIWTGTLQREEIISQINELLKGNGNSNFSILLADQSILAEIKYIIMLDAGTELPRESAAKMIGTLAHPLNKIFYSAEKQKFTAGYSILYPRVKLSLPHSQDLSYSKMHEGCVGTTSYHYTGSDVFQDQFGDGFFIDKAIYDVDAFDQVSKKHLSANGIHRDELHALYYAHSGLINNVQLAQTYPGKYTVDLNKRQAGWRTQFQGSVLIGLTGHLKNFDNPSSPLFRWKAFDDLREQMVPVALTLLLLFGFLISSSTWFWTLTVIGIVCLPSIITLIWNICHKSFYVEFWSHISFYLRPACRNLIRHFLDFVFLPYNAFVNIDAILMKSRYLFISSKKLEGWDAFNLIGNVSEKRHIFYVWVESLLGLLLFTWISHHVSLKINVSIVITSFWIIAPMINWLITRGLTKEKVDVTPQQMDKLKRIARKIWAFFEDFMGDEDNWLPPDNYHLEPVNRIAHHTTPTNIGVALLSTLSAYDFGYIGARQLITRTGNTFNTLTRMEKFKGHFFNGYDTHTLVPLSPKYISSIESGNLAGYILTLKQGLLSLPDKKIISPSVFDGLSDTVGLLIEELEDSGILQPFKKRLDNIIREGINNLQEARDYVEELKLSFIAVHAQLNPEILTDCDLWCQKIILQIQQIKNELMIMVPWILLPKAPAKMEHLISLLPLVPTIRELSQLEGNTLDSIVKCYSLENSAAENEWLRNFQHHIEESVNNAKELLFLIEELVLRCTELVDMDYDCLFDKSQQLLRIGFNVDEYRSENSCYDRLASESRLATFIGIAHNKLPQQSWFSLGRQQTNKGKTPILLSLSGSMSEYLMPLLIMPNYDNTLLAQSSAAMVERQIEYCKKREVPWGISDSHYNQYNNLESQHSYFGIPGTDIKRGRTEDLVISPYSTMLAMMVSPELAFQNLKVLSKNGFEGRYGFYEAIDYTPLRLSVGQTHAVVKSFVARHQGMSLLSISHLLHNQSMPRRLIADVQIKSALLLLKEEIPSDKTTYSYTIGKSLVSTSPSYDISIRVINTPHTPIPEVQLLSNGRYHVMITNAGGGYSRWKDIAVTRWREDATTDNWGNFCYIRDMESNDSWSSAYQPSLKEGDHYEAVFSQGRAEFRRREFSLETHTEIVVSPEDDVELRRLHITNRSRRKRLIEVTSYAEVVLASPVDAAHPAFSNLFVQTELQQQHNAILYTRRPRSQSDNNPAMFHLMKAYKAEVKNVSYETERMKFIGRGNSVHQPFVLQKSDPLSGSQGSVLDPVIAIRYLIEIEPQKTAVIDMVTGIAETKESCVDMIDKYQDKFLVDRGFELSWTHTKVVLRQINASDSDAMLYDKLASAVIYVDPDLRADPEIISRNNRGQSDLWGYAISGDIPMVLVQIENAANIELVKQLIQAHAYWRMKGFDVDLVIWNEDQSNYRHTLQGEIQALIVPLVGAQIKETAGGVFIRSAEQVSNEDRILFQSVARVVLSDRFGSLEEQINHIVKVKQVIPYFTPLRFYPSAYTAVLLPKDLQFFNGTGGFTQDGKEYVMITDNEKVTPVPWCNVVANPDFGSIISDSGQCYTWTENAREFRLSPWNNNRVGDLEGECYFMRDEESGKFWSPAPFPVRSKAPYVTRHGFGYSVFEHSEDGIYSTMTIFADLVSGVKFTVIKLHNQSGRPRKISVTGYIEWVLGEFRTKTQMHVVTYTDVAAGSIFARNAYNTDFENRVAFFDADGMMDSFTCDRKEFIGRNGSIRNPEAMNKIKLSGKTGAALDPCAAIQVVLDIKENELREIIFRLGSGKTMQDVLEIMRQFKGGGAAKTALQKVNHYWDKILTQVQIETPDVAINMLANGWLTYQTIGSRMWARSGFYQSVGAVGFKDQLQDSLSLMHTHPDMAKEKILLCASRQFKEGDVQHWWQPSTGKGVRSACSDDYLWLPFVTSQYVVHTGDMELLNSSIGFLEGRILEAGEKSYLEVPEISTQFASLYEHCVKSIVIGLHFGKHGLPLLVSNKENERAFGESVLLAFFLYDVLSRFEPLAVLKGDIDFAERCKVEAQLLKHSINQYGWDGKWFRRAYFDDGKLLGSISNDECKIDILTQSWAVLSGAVDEEHYRTGMHFAEKLLVNSEEGMIHLFDPPFDKPNLNSRYIKDYFPIMHDNGGQDTEAAIWFVMAFAKTKNKQKTWELIQMLNPINHGNSPESISKYMAEPYVMADNIYKRSGYLGRGEWTWYTGAAGLMYQLIIKYLLGLKKTGDVLTLDPCIPEEWRSFRINYRFKETTYRIQINRIRQKQTMLISTDKLAQADNLIRLVNDGLIHEVEVTIGD